MFGKKKTEVEFTGVSVSNEKRNAIVLFAVEGLVVLIFIVGVLFALNYFGIINFSSLELPPSLSVRPTVISGNPNIEEKALSSIKIETLSAIRGKKLELIDKAKLVSYLDAFGLTNKASISLNEETPLLNFRFDTLKINLTDILQKGNIYAGTNAEPLYSSSAEPSDTSLIINIYLSPKALSDSNASLIAEKSLIVTLFRWGYNPNGLNIIPEKGKDLDVILKGLNNTDRFLSIQ